MVSFDLEYEVELNAPDDRISSTTKARAKSDLVNQSIDAVIGCLDEYNFDASNLSDEDILYYCTLKFNDTPDIDSYSAYGGDLVIAYFYMTCYFDIDKFFEDYG